MAHAPVLLSRPGSRPGPLRLHPGVPDRLERDPQLPPLGPDRRVQALCGVRQLRAVGGRRELLAGRQEHHDLLHRDRHLEHARRPPAGGVSLGQDPPGRALPDDLFPAGDHADGPDGDRLEVDLRLQLRHPQLRALARAPPVRRLADRRKGRPVGADHHERVEGAGVQSHSLPGRDPEYPRRLS